MKKIFKSNKITNKIALYSRLSAALIPNKSVADPKNASRSGPNGNCRFFLLGLLLISLSFLGLST